MTPQPPGSAPDPWLLLQLLSALLFSSHSASNLVEMQTLWAETAPPCHCPYGNFAQSHRAGQIRAGTGSQPQPSSSSQASRHVARKDREICRRARRAPSSGRSHYASSWAWSLRTLRGPPFLMHGGFRSWLDLNACFTRRLRWSIPFIQGLDGRWQKGAQIRTVEGCNLPPAG